MSTSSTHPRPGLRWLRRTAVIVLAIACLGTVIAQPDTSPGLGIRLLEAPVELAADPRAQSYVVDHVAPGTVIERRIEVSNGDPSPLQALLYPVGATIVEDAFLGDERRGRNELASWMSVTPSEATIAPGERQTVTLRIDVPPDASPGERYAILFAERPAGVDQGGMGTTTRVGIRVYLSVGEGAPPAADFRIRSFIANRDRAGAPTLDAEVVNTGGRALDFLGEVSLTDGPGSLVAGPFEVSSGTTIAPGGTAAVQVQLDPSVPAGPWLARMSLRSGLLERTSQAWLTFPAMASEAEPLTAIEVTAPSSLAVRLDDRRLLAMAAGALLLIVGTAGVLMLRRQRRQDPT